MPHEDNRAESSLPLGPAGWARLDAKGFGPLFIGWVDEGVVRIDLDGVRPEDGSLERWLREGEALEERPLPEPIREGLTRYFDGEGFDPASLPARLSGTKFQNRAWGALRRVPLGHVRTYAGLAKDVGSPRSMRAIGTAMAQNPIPIIVPCHRCVAHGYALGGYSGGLDRKRFLLELEGVVVDGDLVRPGQLDMF